MINRCTLSCSGSGNSAKAKASGQSLMETISQRLGLGSKDDGFTLGDFRKRMIGRGDMEKDIAADVVGYECEDGICVPKRGGSMSRRECMKTCGNAVAELPSYFLSKYDRRGKYG